MKSTAAAPTISTESLLMIPDLRQIWSQSFQAQTQPQTDRETSPSATAGTASSTTTSTSSSTSKVELVKPHLLADLLGVRGHQFTVSRPHADVYLVCRVEKVLQGAVASSVEPYVKELASVTGAAGADAKVAAKQFKAMKALCASIAHYRMPFAWGAAYVHFCIEHAFFDSWIIQSATMNCNPPLNEETCFLV